MALRQQIRFTELKAFLDKQGESARAFGRRADIDKMTMHRLLTGKMKRYDANLVQRLAEATKGCVGHAEFAAFLARIASPKRRAA